MLAMSALSVFSGLLAAAQSLRTWPSLSARLGFLIIQSVISQTTFSSDHLTT